MTVIAQTNIETVTLLLIIHKVTHWLLKAIKILTITLFLFLQVRKHITDLYEDLRDGHNLISLLEVLSGVTLVRKQLNYCNTD